MFKLAETYRNNLLYLKNLFFTYFSQGATALSLIILTPFLNHILGFENFGMYGVLLNVIAFSVVFDFGFNTGLLRKYILNTIDKDKLTNSLFIFYLFLLFLIIPSVYLVLSYIVHISHSQIFTISILLSFAIIQNILILYFETLIQSYNLIFIAKILRATKVSLELFITLIFLRTLTIPFLLSITVGTNFLILSFFYIYLYIKHNFRLKLKSFYFDIIIDHFKYSIWYFLTSLASVLVFNSQIILINYLVGSIEAAKFLIITRFFDIIRIAVTNFTQVLTPKIIYIELEGNWNKVKTLFFNVLKRIVILTFILAIVLYIFGPIVFIKWSKLYDLSTLWMFQLYILFISLIIIDNVSFIFLSSLKLNKNTTIVSLLQGSINLILTYYFVMEFGIVGAIYSSLLSFVITNMLYNPYFLLRNLNYKISNNFN